MDESSHWYADSDIDSISWSYSWFTGAELDLKCMPRMPVTIGG